MPRVGVLGAGPAGLLAALAAAQRGYRVQVYAQGAQPSRIQGAQYLHQNIPGVTSTTPEMMLDFQKVGTREGYAEKVYGSSDAPCSWDNFEEGKQPAWDIRSMYGKLWKLFESRVVDLTITPRVIPGLLETNDLLISSVPGKAICADGSHEFTHAEVFITRVLPRHMQAALDENTIIYNGRHNDLWYRASNVGGFRSMEMAGRVPDSVAVQKPLSTTCTCWEGGRLVKVGRYGTWTKGVLVHDAYNKALERLVHAM